MAYKIGLALSGGGIRGISHAGVLMAMEELNIKPEIISGVSAGAIVGALYADGYKPLEIAQMFEDIRFKRMTKLDVPAGGFFSIAPFARFIGKKLKAKTFEELTIPFKIVASNFDTGVPETFSEGDLLKPVIASCSIPVLFVPQKIKNNYYVDGGLLKNFPVSTIREDCDLVIGVNVGPLVAQKYKVNIMDVAFRTYHFMFRANTIADKEICDIIIEPENIYDFDLFETDKVMEIFDLGYQTAIQVLNLKGFY
ncbi:MAG: patatin-like phospholipase family protein [Paludibacter sp.]|nr:patatin-like phospholipase family protein [Paludibacter sp.]MDD4199384.1 patatin-like phospholipase family protein [Paludibacter sp.]MDD4427213.1 patatin-like phospholipase family protein [Paludibacter sp.]